MLLLCQFEINYPYKLCEFTLQNMIKLRNLEWKNTSLEIYKRLGNSRWELSNGLFPGFPVREFPVALVAGCTRQTSDRQTDRQTSDAHRSLNAPPRGRRHDK